MFPSASATSSSPHHQVVLSNTLVSFPGQPYPCQLTYMEKVLESLDKGQNALLESPTGTGKTLSLLCSALGWQAKVKENLRSKQGLPAGFKVLTKTEKSAGSGGGLSKLATRIGLTNEMTSAINSLGSSTEGSQPPPPIILYATRTHSQLSQVISELKRTSYYPKMTLLGSREQLCINPAVNHQKGTVLNHTCTVLSSKKSCYYKNNLEFLHNTTVSSSTNNVFDIESLYQYGLTNNVCSYFYSRDIIEHSEVIFLPYNYLLDSNIRKTLKIEWTNSIIIFDEAHNIEKVASDSSSFSISSTEIALCIEELQEVLRNIKEEYENTSMSSKNGANDSGSSGNGGNPADPVDSSVQKPSLKLTFHLLSSMFQLEKALDGLQLSVPKGNIGISNPCFINSGQWLAALYATSGFNHISHVEELRKCANYLMELNERSVNQANNNIGGGGSIYSSEPKLVLFTTTFERILKSISSFANDFKVYIADEIENTKAPGKQMGKFVYNNSNSNVKKRVINFWCFTTGVALTELKSLGVRSILLTSGTLSPIEALKDDLRLPFEIELINPHVISPGQIWLGALSKGVNGKTLNSSYNNRDSDEYKDELGDTILSIYKDLVSITKNSVSSNKTKSVKSIANSALFSLTNTKDKSKSESLPNGNENTGASIVNSTNGGVLVFFPTYAVMDSTVNRWKDTGVFDSLRSSIGSIIVEPKGSSTSKSNSGNGNSSSRMFMSESKKLSFDNTSSLYSAHSSLIQRNKPSTARPTINTNSNNNSNSNESDDQVFNNIIINFEKSIKKWGSCLLLGVCRGKVSEGIDFSNEKGRVVVITGIPYAPFQDPWVVLKKQYLDERIIKKNGGGSINNNNTNSSNGTISTEKNLWLQARSTSTNTSSAPVSTSMASNTQMLTGSLWYSQSASRAVNQALGRVIRHKKDWGAIFLLDERFQYDKQIEQLSTWLRPRLKKFNQYQQTSSDFSSFLNVIARDKSLTIHVEPILDSDVLAQNQKKKSQSIVINQVKKVLEINESQIDDVEASYINKELLMTQVVEKVDNSVPIAFKVTSAPAPKPNLKSIIDRMRGEISTKNDSTSSGSISSSSEVRNNSISENGNTSIEPQSSNDLVRDPLYKFQPSDSNLMLSQSSCKFQLSQHINQEEDRKKDIKEAKNEWKKVENNKMEDLKPLIKSLKAITSVEIMNQLKSLIQKTKLNGGIVSLIQINNFLLSFFNLFKYNGNNFSSQIEIIINDLALKLVLLVQNEEIKPIFLEKSRQLYSNYKLRGFFHKNSSSSESINNSNNDRKRIFSVIDSISEDGKSLGSERAKKLLSLSQSSTSNQISSNSNQDKNRIQKMFSISKLDSTSSPSNSTLLECVICLKAQTLCAAKCGHICCEKCWRRWFQTHLTCPQCRSPADIDSITKIIIKKST